MPRLLAVCLISTLAAAPLLLSAAVTSAATPVSVPALTCQSVKVADKVSCDEMCAREHAACVAVMTDMVGSPAPITCETPLPAVSGAVCRCCALR